VKYGSPRSALHVPAFECDKHNGSKRIRFWSFALKMDFTKPHAEIYNHPRAKYEQFGRLYGPTGESIDTPTIHVSTKTSPQLQQVKK